MRAIVTVVGKDKSGIIAGVSTVLSEHNANILDISQTILQEYFVMMMMVELPKDGCDFAQLQNLLYEEGSRIGVEIRMMREELFNAMHRL